MKICNPIYENRHQAFPSCQLTVSSKLRQLATEYKVDDNHYAGRKRHLPVKQGDHLYILRDPNKCILCGCCVRICSEVEGIAALGFTSRGFDTVIEPALSVPLAETLCESCGQCVSTCPTGALTPKVCLPKPGPWKGETVSTICPYCGIGCNIELNVVGDKIVKVTSPVDSLVNNGNLCKKGAFDPCSVRGLKRLSKPLIKRNGDLVEASWEEAIARAGEGLRQIRERGGGDRLAILSSSRLTNEENYLVQKLARAALGTNNIGNLANLVTNESMMKSFGRNASTCSYNDILTSDLIIAFGCDIAEDYPVVTLKVREAVVKGSKLVIVNSRATRMDPLAKVNLRVNPRTTLALLKTMLNYIITYDLVDHDFVQSRTTGFEDFARDMRRYPAEDIADAFWMKPSKVIEAIHLYIRARRPVIIVNADTVTPDELTLIDNLALVTGNVGRDACRRPTCFPTI